LSEKDKEKAEINDLAKKSRDPDPRIFEEFIFKNTAHLDFSDGGVILVISEKYVIHLSNAQNLLLGIKKTAISCRFCKF
jgi:hypothetical protein